MRNSPAAHGRVMLLALLAVALVASTSWAQGRGGSREARPEQDAKAPAATPAAKDAPAAADAAPAERKAAAAGSKAGKKARKSKKKGKKAASPDTTTLAPEPATPPVAETDEAAEAAEAEALAAMPDNLRLRSLEQRVQELKERSWRTKARVSMLEEKVLGGGVGANATIVHVDKMGSSYELVQLVYNLDGTQIFARDADTGALVAAEEIEVLAGPLSPGSHTVSVLAVYEGRGYGVFKYMNKYKFTVRSSHTFSANEGKATRIEAIAFERGNVTTPVQQRPAIDFKISYGEKGAAQVAD